jgi:Zn finger protein HypA/HybF involved in hydrogenase expression
LSATTVKRLIAYQTQKFNGGKSMKTPIVASVQFTCPQCSANFEFDAVGEYELVPCPVCGSNFVTVKKGRKLMLEALEQTLMC